MPARQEISCHVRNSWGRYLHTYAEFYRDVYNEKISIMQMNIVCANYLSSGKIKVSQ